LVGTKSAKERFLWKRKKRKPPPKQPQTKKKQKKKPIINERWPSTRGRGGQLPFSHLRLQKKMLSLSTDCLSKLSAKDRIVDRRSHCRSEDEEAYSFLITEGVL